MKRAVLQRSYLPLYAIDSSSYYLIGHPVTGNKQTPPTGKSFLHHLAKKRVTVVASCIDLLDTPRPASWLHYAASMTDNQQA